MSAPELTRAKAEAEAARRRLAASAAALHQRLKPATLASNAWEGVKGKGSDLADGAVEAVKGRPVAVSAALGAFTLFLAREPIKAGLARLFQDDAGGAESETPKAPRTRKAGARDKGASS
ncbi:MAG TPA: DUF3618 domain-containing protein [Allosphingosinicella sp.]|nr:DUF3618 domain-containing protein [Allosphingosinicella sp.]